MNRTEREIVAYIRRRCDEYDGVDVLEWRAVAYAISRGEHRPERPGRWVVKTNYTSGPNWYVAPGRGMICRTIKEAQVFESLKDAKTCVMGRCGGTVVRLVPKKVKT